MNIRDKIIEWQSFFVSDGCCSTAEIEESDRDLEMVLFVIDVMKANIVGDDQPLPKEGCAGGSGGRFIDIGDK